MRFRLVPKSVTLNDLEWRNGRFVALFFLIILNHGRAVVLATAELLVSKRVKPPLLIAVSLSIYGNELYTDGPPTEKLSIVSS